MLHKKFGGSSAQRTLACNGWANESAGIPNSVGAAAHRGTALHDLFEKGMMDPDTNFHPYIGNTVMVDGAEYTFTDEDINDSLASALEAATDLIEAEGVTDIVAEVFTEVSPLIGGSADLLMCSDDTIIVADLKTGFGHQVFPENNAQLLFYAWICTQNAEVDDMFGERNRVVLAIIQPNNRDLPVLRTWETTYEAVMAFGKRFLLAVQFAETEAATLNPGSWCLFCPAAALCSEREARAVNALKCDPSDLGILANNLDMLDELRSWIGAVDKLAYEQLNQGAGVPGYKLVAKRATTYYTVDEEVLINRLRRKLGGIKGMTKPHQILSPAQLKKLAKAKGVEIDFSQITEKRSTGNAVAHESDKRPAIMPAAAIQDALAGLGKPGQFSANNDNVKGKA